MNSDRYMKVILTVLALGVWALVLKPGFQPIAAQAQAKTSVQKVVTAYREFDLISVNSGAGDVNDALKRLYERQKLGWQIISLSATPAGPGISSQMTVVLGKP